MDGAVEEYHTEYKPLLEKLKKEKADAQKAETAAQVEKLRQDSQGKVHHGTATTAPQQRQNSATVLTQPWYTNSTPVTRQWHHSGCHALRDIRIVDIRIADIRISDACVPICVSCTVP